MDEEKYEKLLTVVRGMNTSAAEHSESTELDGEWLVVEEKVEMVLATMLPGIWPDQRGIGERLAQCMEDEAKVGARIDSLEETHRCPRCREDFENTSVRDAVALPCPGKQHFLCQKCILLEEDVFKCPSCRYAAFLAL